MRVLGIDYGTKRLGLAVSDETGVLASPLPTLHRTEEAEDLRRIASIVAERGVTSIVVGLPINMDGTHGPMCQEVREFSARIANEIGVPVDTFDERLTSMEAERVLIEAGIQRKRRKGIRDGLAAVLILQGFLDRCRHTTSESPPSS